MTTEKYITAAREAVSTYNAVGSESVIELQDILAVLIGPSATPEFTGRLAARGIRSLVDMTVPELEAEGLTHNEAQYASLRERGMLTVWGPIFNMGTHTNKMRLICSRYRYRQPI